MIHFHLKEGRLATLTAVEPPGRFGVLAYERGRVLRIEEKPPGDGQFVNGGFFSLEPYVLGLIYGDECTWEDQPLKLLAEQGQLSAFKQSGFSQPMDTLRDRHLLEDLCASGNAPWKVW